MTGSIPFQREMSGVRLLVESISFLHSRISFLEQSIGSLGDDGDVAVMPARATTLPGVKRVPYELLPREDEEDEADTSEEPAASAAHPPLPAAADDDGFTVVGKNGKAARPPPAAPKSASVRKFDDFDTHDERRFDERRFHPRGQNELIPNQYEQVELKKGQKFYSEEKVRRMVEQFNEYWFLLTGKQIHFVFYVENQPYVSLSAPSRHAWVCVLKLFPHRPIIVDAFGGVATEGLTAMLETCPYRYIWVNDTDSIVADAKSRLKLKGQAQRGLAGFPEAAPVVHNIYDTAKANIDNFMTAFPQLKGVVDVQYAQTFASTFLLETKNKIFDCVFLDPPWFKDGYDMSAAVEVMDFVKKEIFDVINDRKFVVVVYMMKMRFGKAIMEQLVPKYLPGYRLLYTIYATPLKNTYAYHIIISEKAEALRWQKDEIFEYVYGLDHNNHKKKRLPVDKDGHPVYIEPITPDHFYRFPPTVPLPFFTYDPDPTKSDESFQSKPKIYTPGNPAVRPGKGHSKAVSFSRRGARR